jgi:hypothetical protein
MDEMGVYELSVMHVMIRASGVRCTIQNAHVIMAGSRRSVATTAMEDYNERASITAYRFEKYAHLQTAG